MLPASPKVFYGREEEVAHIINTMRSTPAARISVCGAEGIGKTAVALAASHSAELVKMFKDYRYFVDCEGATDSKQLVTILANHFGLESGGRMRLIRHLATLATEARPVLLVLDALDRAWKPHENRDDVEDFLSLLADSQYLTLIVTVRGGEHPRQVPWTPLLHLHPLPLDAARQTFLDISDVSTDEPELDTLLALADNNPGTLTFLAGLASFEGCVSLVSRWESEVPALRAGRVVERDILAMLENERARVREPLPTIDSLLMRSLRHESTLVSRSSTSSIGSVGFVGSRVSTPLDAARQTFLDISDVPTDAFSDGPTAQTSLHAVNASRASLPESNLVVLSSSPLPQVSTGGHDAQEVEHHLATLPARSDSATSNTLHTLNTASQPSLARPDAGAQLVEQRSNWSPTSTLVSNLGSRSSSLLPGVSTGGHVQEVGLITSWSASSVTAGSFRSRRSSPPPARVSIIRRFRLLRPFRTS